MPQTIPVPQVIPVAPADLFPAGGSGTGSVGTSGNKWAEVVATTLKSEDFNMFRGEIRNTLVELPDGQLMIVDRNTGKFFRVVTKEEIGPIEDWIPSDGQPVVIPPTTLNVNERKS